MRPVNIAISLSTHIQSSILIDFLPSATRIEDLVIVFETCMS
jgi:hypothetical protein